MCVVITLIHVLLLLPDNQLYVAGVSPARLVHLAHITIAVVDYSDDHPCNSQTAVRYRDEQASYVSYAHSSIVDPW